jgi:hypothetical protein
VGLTGTGSAERFQRSFNLRTFSRGCANPGLGCGIPLGFGETGKRFLDFVSRGGRKIPLGFGMRSSRSGGSHNLGEGMDRPCLPRAKLGLAPGGGAGVLRAIDGAARAVRGSGKVDVFPHEQPRFAAGFTGLRSGGKRAGSEDEAGGAGLAEVSAEVHAGNCEARGKGGAAFRGCSLSRRGMDTGREHVGRCLGGGKVNSDFACAAEFVEIGDVLEASGGFLGR